MNEKNHSDIGRALNHLLRPTLTDFIGHRLTKIFGNENWWQRGVLDVLYDHQKSDLPSGGSYGQLLDSLDVSRCLLLLDVRWNEIFGDGLPRSCFNCVKELQSVRNEWAHPNANSFDDETTRRALDTMIFLSEKLVPDSAEELRKILAERTAPVVVEPPKMSRQPQISTHEILPAWRDVITPHPDVARGEQSQSEWAVNLANVVFKKEGSAEYTEPVEFFTRTYLTDGLKDLLVQILRRVTNGRGEPVIQLKTSFGGGKTHSLLALYHLLGGRIRADQSSSVREVLEAAKVSTLPKVNTAVFVGTWLNPLKTTLWGEITAQLAHAASKPELYEMIRRNEELDAPPGVEDLRKFLDAASPCLILIDELVAYGRVLNAEKSDKLIAFVQQLTEAVGTSSQAALVVSIPQSEAEVGKGRGRVILKQLEKIFGRVEFVWTPVSKTEGYEIVRRRLFGQCNESEREKVCAAFFNMYVNNPNDFPAEIRRNDYKNQLLACYPIHPQLFDFFHDKWTGLENFQKTRGVLRLMSKVIHHLWKRGDRSAMIMPCDIPLDASDVNAELTKTLLGKNWQSIVDAEIDGDGSKAQNLDKNPRFGNLLAARKIARSIFMGTAPTQREGDVRGITEDCIHTCTIQPQNVANIAVFNDALTKLRTNLYYLYSSGSRFWFDTTATLRKVVDEKREKYSDDDIFAEIEDRIKTWRGFGEFKAVYTCPKTSADVPDEQTARLVILSPKCTFNATNIARDFLDNRGSVPRQNKNMLLFLAAIPEKIGDLKDVVREFKAWIDVDAEKLSLNLTQFQLDEVAKNIESATKNFLIKLSQAYCRAIYPVSDENSALNLPLRDEKIPECTNEKNISAASDYFTKAEILLTGLGAQELQRRLENRNFIWSEGDTVNVNQLWEYFLKYYYMPRLVDRNILFEAIRRAVKSEIFALADDENFSNLQFGDVAATVDGEKFLVKGARAKQLVDAQKKDEPESEKVEPAEVDEPHEESTPPAEESLPTKFFMDTQLDNDRYDKHFKKCMGNTAEFLMSLPNAQVEIRFSVTVTVPEGIQRDMQDMIESNCRDLQINNFYFER